MTNCCIQKIPLSCSFVQYNCVLFMLHCKSVHKLCTESNVEARSRDDMNARSQTLNEKKTLLYAERASGFFLPRDNVRVTFKEISPVCATWLVCMKNCSWPFGNCVRIIWTRFFLHQTKTRGYQNRNSNVTEKI